MKARVEQLKKRLYLKVSSRTLLEYLLSECLSEEKAFAYLEKFAKTQLNMEVELDDDGNLT